MGFRSDRLCDIHIQVIYRHVARLKFKSRQLHRPLAKSWALWSLVNRSSSIYKSKRSVAMPMVMYYIDVSMCVCLFVLCAQVNVLHKWCLIICPHMRLTVP